MPVFAYHPCDPRIDPLGCFIYPDILNRLDQFLPPVVSEAAQNTVPPPRNYDMQFVVNPAAGGGRVGGLVKQFQRRASIEPFLRIFGRPIETSLSVNEMTERFSIARGGHAWRNPFYLPVLSGDSGLSNVLDALSRLPDQWGSHVVVVPINGVGTARDIPRVAGAPSFTERLPHAFTRSVSVHYHGVDVSGDIGAGRHFHSIALGVGGKLFEIVHEVVERHPILLRLKRLSGAFGVLPYLVAFAPLYNLVRKGSLVTEVEVTRGNEVVFRGRTCGVITAIVPGMGGVTRIPGVDPTHGEVRVLILPESARAALATILEGVWWHIKSLIPGAEIPDRILSLPADRQISPGPFRVRLKFSTPTPMEANGDYIGETTELVLQVGDKPTSMMVRRNSLLARLDGYHQSHPTIESVLRMGEWALIGAGLVGALYPKLSPEDYRDLTHKLMVGMVHATTLAVMLRNGSPLAFHLRLLSMLPAFLLMQKGAELLPITGKKWQTFAQNYLPLALMGVMQYFRVVPTIGNAVRLVAPGTYSAIMGSRLATGMARGAVGKFVSGLYYGGYLAGMIVYLYQSIGDLGERNRTASSYLESVLRSDTPDALATWGRETLKRAGVDAETIGAVSALSHVPGGEVETSLKQALRPADWVRLETLTGRLQRLDLNRVQGLAKQISDRDAPTRNITARAWMMAAHVDTDQAYWRDALLKSLMRHDPDILSAANTPGLFVLAAALAFHRRHEVPPPASPEPSFLHPLLAFLTLNTG